MARKPAKQRKQVKSKMEQYRMDAFKDGREAFISGEPFDCPIQHLDYRINWYDGYIYERTLEKYGIPVPEYGRKAEGV